MHAGVSRHCAGAGTRSEQHDVGSQSLVTDAADVCWAQVLWLHYLERFRNLQYLEAQLDSYQR
jgi:hypothetical protein